MFKARKKKILIRGAHYLKNPVKKKKRRRKDREKKKSLLFTYES